MGSLSTLEIIGIIVLVLLFGGVIFRFAKRLLTIAFIAILVILGIYFVNPKVLHDWFGKENVDKIENKVGEGLEDAKKETREFADEALDSK